MENNDPFKEQKLKKLQLMLYLLPVVGWLPSLWTLSRHDENRSQRSLARTSLTLTLGWAIAYSLLWLGSLQTSELLALRLLYLNGLLTSGYILTCLVLMVRVWRGKV